MKIFKIISFSVLFCLLSSLVYAGTTINYDPNAAKIYAANYCHSRNDDPTKDFSYRSDYANDCANFMSQALIAGGLDFSCLIGKGIDSIGIGKKNKGQKGVIKASVLLQVLKDSFKGKRGQIYFRMDLF